MYARSSKFSMRPSQSSLFWLCNDSKSLYSLSNLKCGHKKSGVLTDTTDTITRTVHLGTQITSLFSRTVCVNASLSCTPRQSCRQIKGSSPDTLVDRVEHMSGLFFSLSNTCAKRRFEPIREHTGNVLVLVWPLYSMVSQLKRGPPLSPS